MLYTQYTVILKLINVSNALVTLLTITHLPCCQVSSVCHIAWFAATGLAPALPDVSHPGPGIWAPDTSLGNNESSGHPGQAAQADIAATERSEANAMNNTSYSSLLFLVWTSWLWWIWTRRNIIGSDWEKIELNDKAERLRALGKLELGGQTFLKLLTEPKWSTPLYVLLTFECLRLIVNYVFYLILGIESIFAWEQWSKCKYYKVLRSALWLSKLRLSLLWEWDGKYIYFYCYKNTVFIHFFMTNDTIDALTKDPFECLRSN